MFRFRSFPNEFINFSVLVSQKKLTVVWRVKYDIHQTANSCVVTMFSNTFTSRKELEVNHGGVTTYVYIYICYIMYIRGYMGVILGILADILGLYWGNGK